MKNRISKRIYNICLIILEKYDYPRGIVWKLTKKVYDKAFYGAYGSGPYGVTIWTKDNTKYDFWFKFQWLQYLYQSYAKRNGLKEEGAIVYSNKVWRVWKLRHNIAYRLH